MPDFWVTKEFFRARQMHLPGDMVDWTEEEARHNLEADRLERIVFFYPGQCIIKEVLDVPVRTRRHSSYAVLNAAE